MSQLAESGGHGARESLGGRAGSPPRGGGLLLAVLTLRDVGRRRRRPLALRRRGAHGRHGAAVAAVAILVAGAAVFPSSSFPSAATDHRDVRYVDDVVMATDGSLNKFTRNRRVPLFSKCARVGVSFALESVCARLDARRVPSAPVSLCVRLGRRPTLRRGR